jgi:hypothetical protein
MNSTNRYHIARYTLTGRKLGENTFKTQEEAKKFMRDYLYITFSKTPDEELLEKIFEDINNTDGVYKFLYRDMYLFITKLNRNS